MRDKLVALLIYSWLPLAFIATMVFGIFYLVLQQQLRLSANDPQLQMAEDISSQLGSGQPVLSVIPEQKVNLNLSLAPFILIYDENGQLLGSTGQLNYKDPVFPTSVFSNARQTQEEALTWEPESGERFAVVVVPYAGTSQSGFIVVGRSLREIEDRINVMGVDILAGWLVCVFGLGIIIFYINRKDMLVYKVTVNDSKKPVRKRLVKKGSEKQ